MKEGEGKYTWPTGAVYRGDWHDGCMHGHGTLQGPDGSIYTGVCFAVGPLCTRPAMQPCSCSIVPDMAAAS